MVKRVRYIIFIACVFLAGSYVALKVIGTGDFYRTPAELKTQVSTEQAQLERVGGEVINSAVSVQGSLQSTVIKFELQHGGETVPVVYEGVIPNTFRDGAQVIAEGTYSSGQVFEASRVLVKCPDTYLPEKALARFLQGTQLENWLYR